MHRVRYLEHEVTKMCQDLEMMYSLTPDVVQQVRYDLSAGMSREDVKRYCNKKISLLRMKIISECIWKDVDEEVIKRLSSKDKNDDTLEIIYKMIRENVDIATIDSMGSDNNRLLECLEMYRKGLITEAKDNQVEVEASDGESTDGGTSDTEKQSEENNDIQESASKRSMESAEERAGEGLKENSVSEKHSDMESTHKIDSNKERFDAGKQINLVKNVVENINVSTPENNVTKVADHIDISKADSEMNSKNKSNTNEMSNQHPDNNANDKSESRVRDNTITKEDIERLLKGFGSEIVEGVNSVIKSQDRSEQIFESVFKSSIDDLKERLKNKDKEMEQQSENLVEAKKTIDELSDRLEQTIKTYDERIRQIELTASSKCAVVNDDDYSESDANQSNNTSDSSEASTDSLASNKTFTSNESAAYNSKYYYSYIPDSYEDDNSKVIQFSDRAGKQSIYSKVDYSRRKTNGLSALAASLCCKKRSRKSMMQMAINGELSKEQLTHIVEAIRAGLTEEQLCQLIENKVPAEKMPQIIEIAVLENNVGYSA